MLEVHGRRYSQWDSWESMKQRLHGDVHGRKDYKQLTSYAFYTFLHGNFMARAADQRQGTEENDENMKVLVDKVEKKTLQL
ncbi:hypothetical protein E2C01_061481 [Portunus trituberculatus]|uniref:Uncharacterized protein n=1 Tax=Portunus trituberculatus TaxID=210409 RepID=A0A5B7HEH3_PORTR|nr:hypothetical protein [Portunus trituberculatus]